MSHYLNVFKCPNISTFLYQMFGYFDIFELFEIFWYLNLLCCAVKQFSHCPSVIFIVNRPLDEYLKYTHTHVSQLTFSSSSCIMVSHFIDSCQFWKSLAVRNYDLKSSKFLLPVQYTYSGTKLRIGKTQLYKMGVALPLTSGNEDISIVSY